MRPHAPRTTTLGPNAGIEGIGGELPGGGLVLTNRASAPGTVCAGGVREVLGLSREVFRVQSAGGGGPMRPYAPRTAALGPNAGTERIGRDVPVAGLLLTNGASAPGTVCVREVFGLSHEVFRVQSAGGGGPMRPHPPKTTTLGPHAGTERIGVEVPGGGLVLTTGAGAPSAVCAGEVREAFGLSRGVFGSGRQAEAVR